SVRDVDTALKDELSSPEVFHPLDVLPRQCRIELPGDPLRQRGEADRIRDAALENAEGLGACPEHVEGPTRFSRNIKESSQGKSWWYGKPVLEVAVALALDLQVE